MGARNGMPRNAATFVEAFLPRFLTIRGFFDDRVSLTLRVFLTRSFLVCDFRVCFLTAFAFGSRGSR